MALVDATQAGTVGSSRRAFFSPAADFALLGGGSLLLLPILAWFIPDRADSRVAYIAMLASYIINYPHFAHSYQIFYRTFSAVVAGPHSDRVLRARYLWAGIGAPAIIVLLFAAALIPGDARALGYAGNAMAFFVGWHYVKQGYGMLMVDAALHRSYFADADKKLLQLNAYACWILSWLVGNKAVAEQNSWGLAHAAFAVPDELLWAGAIILATSTLIAGRILLRHGAGHRGNVPANGIAAYVAALYPWLFLRWEPVVGVLIPAMHSVQYLLIVWRYQLNLERGKPDAGESWRGISLLGGAVSNGGARFASFVLHGLLWGAVGFWLLPMILEAIVPYDHAEYGHYLFFFILSIFINVHHYFIDNAMWRKENPLTLPHLFARR